MWYFSSCFRARGCTLWACLSPGCGCASCSGCSWSHPSWLSRVRRQLHQWLCLLTALGRGEPLERKRWAGTACCGQARRQRGDALQPASGPCQECCGGSPESAGWPALRAASTSLRHPCRAPTACPTTRSPKGWRRRRRRSFTCLAVCPGTCSTVSTALLGHRVTAAAFTHHLSRGKEKEEQGDSSWGRSPTYGLQCNTAWALMRGFADGNIEILPVEEGFVEATGCITMDFWIPVSGLQAPACPLSALLGPQSQDTRHLVAMLEWGHPLALGPHSTTSVCTLLPFYCYAKPFLLRGFGCGINIKMAKKGHQWTQKSSPRREGRQRGKEEILKYTFWKKNIVEL